MNGVRSQGCRSSLSPQEVAISLPPGLIFPSFHTPVTEHILNCSLLSLPLYSILTHHPVWLNCLCTCVFMHRFDCVPVTATCYRVRSFFVLGTPAPCCRLWCPVFVYCFVFCLSAFLLLNYLLTCIWTQTSLIPRASSLRRDRI